MFYLYFNRYQKLEQNLLLYPSYMLKNYLSVYSIKYCTLLTFLLCSLSLYNSLNLKHNYYHQFYQFICSSYNYC